MSDQIEDLKPDEVSLGDRPVPIPSELPILPLRDTVLFPNSFMPLAVARESSEADIQDEIEFALIQMKSETLNKINDALARLEQGDYGNCFECGEEIAEKRERQMASRRGASSLFMDM